MLLLLVRFVVDALFVKLTAATTAAAAVFTVTVVSIR
jgi:hypothetical protein